MGVYFLPLRKIKKNTFIAIKCDLFTLKKSVNYTLMLSIEYSLVGAKIIISLKKKAIAMFFWHVLQRTNTCTSFLYQEHTFNINTLMFTASNKSCGKSQHFWQFFLSLS